MPNAITIISSDSTVPNRTHQKRVYSSMRSFIAMQVIRKDFADDIVMSEYVRIRDGKIKFWKITL